MLRIGRNQNLSAVASDSESRHASVPDGFSRSLDASPQERFEREVMPHLDSAYNLAVWLLRNDQDAEDATQSALYKAFRSYGKMRSLEPKPWFLAIVRNECMDVLQLRSKRNRRESAVDEHYELVDSQSPDPESALITSWNAEMVRSVINQLPSEFREVILLREVEELSYLQIAAVIQKPIGTVMSRLARARDRVQMMLQNEVKR